MLCFMYTTSDYHEYRWRNFIYNNNNNDEIFYKDII